MRGHLPQGQAAARHPPATTPTTMPAVIPPPLAAKAGFMSSRPSHVESKQQQLPEFIKEVRNAHHCP
jgi:hypothetical protein